MVDEQVEKILLSEDSMNTSAGTNFARVRLDLLAFLEKMIISF